jgi:parvulin-like peptidyl-prolyl isomerase
MMLPSYFASVSEAEISKRAGGGFAAAVMALEPGQWHGPVLSGFGVHLVYVLAREQAPPPVLAAVKPQVLEALQAQKTERFNRQFYDTLRERYEVIVEDADLPPGSLLQVGRGNVAGAPGGAGS